MAGRRLAGALVFLVLLVAGCAASPAPDAKTPGATVAGFLAHYLRDGFRGLPGEEACVALSPWVGGRLLGQLEAARAGQQAYRARFPDDKPPLVDGDLFSSLFEGATDFTVGEVREDGDRAEVTVRYVYADAGTGKVLERWSDRFLLVREPSGWRIDDVAYGGGWDFAPRGRLSEVLAETAALR